MSKNGFPATSINSWREALMKNTNLNQLDLSGNYFNDKSVSTWSELLKSNRTLTTLNLTGNKIKAGVGRRWTWSRETGYVRNDNRKNSRKDLVLDTMCDSTTLKSIVDSNHVCQLFLAKNNNGVSETHERDLRNINALENEGAKIRYKVVLSMFKLNTDLFDPRSFEDVPLELIPRLFELVQQEIGYDGFGAGLVQSRKRYNKDPTLSRLHQVFTSWNIPLLVARGAGKLPPAPKTKGKRKVKTEDDLDEDFKPSYAAKRPSVAVRTGGRKRRSTDFSYADVENSEDESE